MREKQHPEPAGSLYHTFVLRCWQGEGKQVRGRLIDVSTGRSHPVSELAGLPASLERLMLELPRNPKNEP